MKDRPTKKQLLLTTIYSVLLILIIVPAITMGWFALTSDPNLDNVDLGVVQGGIAEVDIQFTPGGTGTVQNPKKLYPDEYAQIEIVLANKTQETKTFMLKMEKVKVVYPTKDENFIYDPKMLKINDYYYSGTNKKLQSSLFSESLFSQFVSPISEAIRYDVFTTKQEEFSKDSTPIYFSDGKRQESLIEDTINIDSDIKINKKTYEQEQTGFFVHDDGSFTLEAGVSAKVYMLIFYEPQRYQTRKVNINETVSELVMKNSNPYIGQTATMVISFEELN